MSSNTTRVPSVYTFLFVQISCNFFSATRAVGQFSLPIREQTDLNKLIRMFGPDERRITLADLKTLDPHIPTSEIRILKNNSSTFEVGWLADVIIDFYLDGVCGSRRSSVLCFPSPTGQLLGSKDIDDSVIKAFKIMADEKYQKIIIPCNPTINHWILLVAFKFSSNIYILDPANDDPLDIRPIRRYAENFVEIWKELTGQQYKYTLPRRVMQSDGHSCGVFVCYYAYRLMYGGKLTQRFDEMDLRHKIYDTLLSY